MKDLRAFTLAEVLITLGIIGIVAAMTLPGLVADYKVKTTVTKLKKVQSVMSQAFLSSINEYGDLSGWDIQKDTKESAERIAERIKPYLKLVDDCGTGNCEKYTTQWQMFNGHTEAETTNFGLDFYYKLTLADGTNLYIRPILNKPNAENQYYATIFVDINGKKSPNIMGQDIFPLYAGKNGNVFPQGTGHDIISSTYAYADCGRQGWYCSSWVMYKENMDYLKCPNDLKWNGQNKCN